MNEQLGKKEFSFPIEIKNLVSPLRNEKHWKILELLLNHDNKLTYTEIRKKLQISEKQKGTLNYHLNELEKGGWLRNYTEIGTDVTDRYSSYYSVTKFGQKVLDGIMQAMSRTVYPNQFVEYMQFTTNTASSVVNEHIKQSIKERYNKTKAKDALERSDLLSDLQLCGLQKTEGVLYLALLEIGPSTVGELSKKITIERAHVYRALERLRSFGFITTTFSNPVLCSAVEPEKALTSMLQRKENEVTTLQKITDKIKDRLEDIQKIPTRQNEKIESQTSFVIIQGRVNIYKQVSQLIQKSSEIIYLVTTTEDVLRMYHTIIPEKINICKAKGGIVRLLTNTDNVDLFPLIERLNASEVRISKIPDSRMVVSKTALILSGALKESADLNDDVDSIVYTDSSEMIDNMYNLCTLLWNKAKPIEIVYDMNRNYEKRE